MERFLKNGDDWRVGWHPHSAKYQGLVGTDSWAVELTKAEFHDFCRLLQQLVATMKEMEAELMDEEKINCEAETNLLWMEVEGYPHSYTLRLILNSDRRCEGNWAKGIAPRLVEAIDSLNIAS